MKTKEEQREYSKKYYQDNRGAVLKRQKKYNKGYHVKIKLERPWVAHFKNAKRRCNNPNDKAYKYYGGKGIKFKLTMDEIKSLYLRDNAKDMKHPTIDRIYSDANYTFGNCRFIELSENVRRSQRRIKCQRERRAREG